MTSLKYGRPFLGGWSGGANTGGEENVGEDREDAEEGSRARGVRAPSYTGLLTRGPTDAGGEHKGERFCFLVTFIWALGGCRGPRFA